MTHTLHRKGTAESLSGDYTLLCIPAMGINDSNHEPKLQEFLRIAMRHNPVNIGSITMGSMYTHKPEETIASAHGIAHAVFDNSASVTEVLKELKQADLGMSVVVGGILDTVNECCQKVGLQRHTVDVSLGIWGNTKRLPSDEILEITTMCGHGMVSTNLVKSVAEDIRKGAKSPEDAAREITPHCCCGVFNPARAAKLLAAMAR